MLSGLRQAQVKPINGVNYNVDSRADWISDGTSSTDCTADGKGADYIKITSKVTPTSQPGLQPVTVTSIVTPAPGTFLATQGSLAVTIVNRKKLEALACECYGIMQQHNGHLGLR